MKISAREVISKISDDFSSLKSPIITKTIRRLVADNKTIYFYLQKVRGKKEKKIYIFHHILNNLFSFLLELYFTSDNNILEEIAGMCRKKFVDNSRIDNALINSLANIQEKKSFGLFIINMMQNFSGTEYQKIFMDAVDKKPKKEISDAIVTYFLSLKTPYLNKLEKISILFQKERLTLIAISLLENIVRIKNIQNSNRNKMMENIYGIISTIDDLYGEDVYFYFPLFIGYTGGIFDGIGMENIKNMIVKKIETHKEYKELIELAEKNKKEISLKMDKIIQRRDKVIHKKEQKLDGYWEQQFYENKILFATYLCETSSRLFQLEDDAEKQNVDTESTLYQRIVVTIGYLKGILKLFDVEIFGQPGEITEFDHKVHKCMDDKNVSGQVKVVTPGFIFKETTGKKNVLKKSVVSLKKEIKK